jgi:thioredoxin reductase (NADPH)
MAMIDPKTREILAQQFKSDLPDPIEILLVTARLNVTPEQEEALLFVRNLLTEFSEIDSRIKFKECGIYDEPAASLKITTIPSLIFAPEKGHKIIFNGTPSGQEGQTLIQIIKMLLSGKSGLSHANEEKLKSLTGTARIQVFVTPTCPFCPASCVFAARVAMASAGKVTTECVEAEENPDLSMKFNVSSVPMYVINSDPASAVTGVPKEDDLVSQVIRYAAGT